MATYTQIQDYIKQKYNNTPKTCWIAHAKELSGLPVKRSHRRKGERVYPCPEDKLPDIQDAFRYFGMMEERGEVEVYVTF